MGDQQKRLYLGPQPKRVAHGAPLCRECNCLNFSNSDLCQKCSQRKAATATTANGNSNGNGNSMYNGRTSNMTPQGVLRLRNPILQAQSRGSMEGQRPPPTTAGNATTRLLGQPRQPPHNNNNNSNNSNSTRSNSSDSFHAFLVNQSANKRNEQVRPSATTTANSGFVVPGRSFGPAVYGGIMPHVSTSGGSSNGRATATAAPPPRVAGSAPAAVPARAPSPANRPTNTSTSITSPSTNTSTSSSSSSSNSTQAQAQTAPSAAVASPAPAPAPAAARKPESSSAIGGKRVRVETVTLTREVIDLISSDEDETEADHNRNEAERARHELAVSRFALRRAADRDDEENATAQDASTELREPKNEQDELQKKTNKTTATSQETETETEKENVPSDDADERIQHEPIQSRCFDEIVFEVDDFPTSDVVAQEMKRARRMAPPPPSASPASSTAAGSVTATTVGEAASLPVLNVLAAIQEPPQPTAIVAPPPSAAPAAEAVSVAPSPASAPAPAPVSVVAATASHPVSSVQDKKAAPPIPGAMSSLPVAVFGPAPAPTSAASGPQLQPATQSPAPPQVSVPIQIPAQAPTEAPVPAAPAPTSLLHSPSTAPPPSATLPPVAVAPTAAVASVALPPPAPAPASATTESSPGLVRSDTVSTPSAIAAASTPQCIIVDDSDDDEQAASNPVVRDRVLFQSRVFDEMEFDTKDFSDSLNLARRSGPVAATAPTPAMPQPSIPSAGASAENARSGELPPVAPQAIASTSPPLPVPVPPPAPTPTPSIGVRDAGNAVSATPSTAATATVAATVAATVLQPRKKPTNETTASTIPPPAHDRPRGSPVPVTAASVPDSPLIKREKVATPRTAPICKPSLGYCGPDFLQFMRECVDGDDEIDEEDEDELARVKLLEVVDLTHFSDESGDEEEDEEDDFFEIVEKVAPVARPALGESVGTTLTGQVSGGAPLLSSSNPEVVAKIKRTRAPRPKEPCMICEEKAWIKSLVHCAECKKYYHKRCAREYGDETICWNCDMEGMIDDSEVTADHDQVLGMLKSLHASPDYDTEAGGEDEEGERNDGSDDGEHAEEKQDDSVAPRANSSSSSSSSLQVLSTLKKQTTRSMKMWKAFQEVGTETIKQEFEETTNRITQELQDEANRAKYTKSFATKEIVEQAMDEVVDHYANLQDREERMQREDRVRSPPSSAMASPESVETSSSNATTDSSIATGSSGATPLTEPPPTLFVHATTTTGADAGAVPSISGGVFPMDPSKPSQSS